MESLLFDDAELIKVETVLTSDTLNIRNGASTPETRERYAFPENQTDRQHLVRGERGCLLYRMGPVGVTVFDTRKWGMMRERRCPCCDSYLSAEEWGQALLWLELALGVKVSPDGYTDTKGAARYLSRRPQTLKNWRVNGGGPIYTKDGKGRIRYSLDDLRAFNEGGADINGDIEEDKIQYTLSPVAMKYR